MSSTEAGEILRQLAAPDTDSEMAEGLMARLDGQESAAVLDVFRWLHDARDERALHAAVALAARWAGRPVAEALVPALRALLLETDVDDLNKLAAADLLARFGEPVGQLELAGHLQNPAALAHASLGRALEAIEDNPLALVRFLDALGQEPPEFVADLIEDLAALVDRGDVPPAAAAAVLAPLTQASNPDVALAAVAAIDVLGLGEAAAALALVATGHPDPTVRHEAERTLLGLPPAPPRPEAVPPVRVWLSEAGADGGQYVVLARGGEDGGTWAVLTLYHNAAAGVLHYGSLDLVTEADLGALVARLASAGRLLAPARPGEAAWCLEAAAARTLSAGAAPAVGYAAWPWILGPVRPERPDQAPSAI